MKSNSKKQYDGTNGRSKIDGFVRKFTSLKGLQFFALLRFTLSSVPALFGSFNCLAFAATTPPWSLSSFLVDMS